MHQIVSEIGKILEREILFYREIYSLENEKTEAVIRKNGTLIQEICSLQEKLVFNIESLESERENIMNRMEQHEKRATLSDIAAKLDPGLSAVIMKSGSELKDLLIKLRDKQEANSRLLQDNIEFFSILISDLKNSSSLKSGYSSDGKENVRVVNPVLFNTTA